MGSDVSTYAGIRDNAVTGDLLLPNEEDGVGARGLPSTHALGKHAQVIGEGPDPCFAVGAFDEVSVLKGSPRDLVDDRIGLGHVGDLGAEVVRGAGGSSSRSGAMR